MCTNTEALVKPRHQDSGKGPDFHFCCMVRVLVSTQTYYFSVSLTSDQILQYRDRRDL